jgi:hypothetical protein
VDDIKNKSGSQHGNIIKEIEILSRKKLNFSFNHEGRLSNKEAHCLAKHALGLDESRHLWLINSPPLLSIPVNFMIQ